MKRRLIIGLLAATLITTMVGCEKKLTTGDADLDAAIEEIRGEIEAEAKENEVINNGIVKSLAKSVKTDDVYLVEYTSEYGVEYASFVFDLISDTPLVTNNTKIDIELYGTKDGEEKLITTYNEDILEGGNVKKLTMRNGYNSQSFNIPVDNEDLRKTIAKVLDWNGYDGFRVELEYLRKVDYCAPELIESISIEFDSNDFERIDVLEYAKKKFNKEYKNTPKVVITDTYEISIEDVTVGEDIYAKVKYKNITNFPTQELKGYLVLTNEYGQCYKEFLVDVAALNPGEETIVEYTLYKSAEDSCSSSKFIGEVSVDGKVYRMAY